MSTIDTGVNRICTYSSKWVKSAVGVKMMRVFKDYMGIYFQYNPKSYGLVTNYN